jgi:hypothetical protein
MKSNNDYSDESTDEEEWLYTCRRNRVYNGPPGGPPGLRRDEPVDTQKAKRFRKLCNSYIEKYPNNPINIIWFMAETIIELEQNEQPYIRGQVASEQSNYIMENVFYEEKSK